MRSLVFGLSKPPPPRNGSDRSYRLPVWAIRSCNLLLGCLLVPLFFWAMAAGAWRALDTRVANTRFALFFQDDNWSMVGGALFYAVGAFGAVLLVLIGAGMIGGAFGFLFGLPRMEPQGGVSVQQDRAVATGAGARTGGDPPEARAGGPPAGVSPAGGVSPLSPRAVTGDPPPRAERSTTRTGFRMSPALNEIADWLTKIIVGLGLVQADKIGAGFVGAMNFLLLNGGLGRFPAGGVVVPASMLIGLIGGFMLSYLAMTLLIGPQIARAADDLETVAELKDSEKRAQEVASEATRRREEAEEHASKVASEANQRRKEAEEQRRLDEERSRERARLVDRWRKFDLLELLSKQPDRAKPKVTDAAKTFAEASVTDCITPDEKLAWAKINVVLDRGDQALQAYVSEMERPTAGFRLLQEGFLLAERLGAGSVAAGFRHRIETLWQSSPGSVAPQDWARFQLSLIEKDLYDPARKGYERVLDALPRLRASVPAAEREPSFHVFWAAALGQKYAAEKEAGADGTVLDALVAAALEQIRQARGAGQEDWLRYLADESLGAREVSCDDDLVEIAKRKEVREAIWPEQGTSRAG